MTPTAAAPLITSPHSHTAGVGHTFSFTVTADRTPKPAITESGLPEPGVNFTPAADGGSATACGTPPTGSDGVYQITFGASNGVGFPVTQNATLSVLELTSPTSATFPLNQSDSFTIITPQAASSVTIALSGSLPPDVSFNVGQQRDSHAQRRARRQGQDLHHDLQSHIPHGAATTQKFTLTTTFPRHEGRAGGRLLEVTASMSGRSAQICSAFSPPVPGGQQVSTVTADTRLAARRVPA